MQTNQDIFFALPKGRILKSILPILEIIGIKPEADFFKNESRKLIFSTNIQNLKIVKTRSFDVASFVASGKVDLGICGLDVIEEFPHNQILRLKNLNIGKCRLSLAGKHKDKLSNFSTHLTIATKYTNLASKLLKQQGYQVEILKLNGAIELASHLNLANFIVDLVSTGETLKANQLEEKQVLLNISSYLIANKRCYQAKYDILDPIITNLRQLNYK